LFADGTRVPDCEDSEGHCRVYLNDLERLAQDATATWLANLSPHHVMDFITTNLAGMAKAIEND